VRIDPGTNSVITTIAVGDSPTGVEVGAGSVWVANSGDGTLSRVDPGTNKVIATITVGGSPQAIAIANGRVWVTIDAPPTVRATAPARGGLLRVDIPDDVDSMDPALAYTSPALQLLQATCAKLLNYPDKAGQAGSQLTAEVATSLPTRSADGTTYTFTIRDGFRFSPPSNAPVTAQTFKYAIERSLSPQMKSPVDYQFGDIVGARAYMAGKAPHITGVTAEGDKLTIRLLAPAPDLLARVAQTVFCAVPDGTPIDPNGLRAIPMAGPYYIASYGPGQGIVLNRNPNYHGHRPHSLGEIDVAVNVRPDRAAAQIEAGRADYAPVVSRSEAPTLAARYGPGSPAAARGTQQYFINPQDGLWFLPLNTHRPPFSNVRLREAVNYAVDRAALARAGGFLGPPLQPTDQYLPPGMPGHDEVRIYPFRPDIAKARKLAQGQRATAALYTCNEPSCEQQAQIVKTDLAAIGISVEVQAFPFPTLYYKINHGAPWDLANVGWAADYPDPRDFLNYLLEDGSTIPTFDDPTYTRRLAQTAQLSGPTRYLTYAALATDLDRNAAPWIAYGNLSSHDFFSARIGCQTYGPYGMDLAALCIRSARR
jgi:peptide/nickel transport system substrate-binding protein